MKNENSELVVIDTPASQIEVQGERKLKFGRNNEFQVELRRRIHLFFLKTGKPERDCPQMYLKTAILLSSFLLTYILLVFVCRAWWQALPLAVLLGLIMAGIGFNIQHDGGHQAYSSRPWVNKMMGMTLDLIGANSYNWHWKHVAFHHTYVNINGHDTDIDLGILARFAPDQPRLPFHRFQHLYLWPLYGFVAIKWHLWDDFYNALTGKIGGHRYPRPKGKELVLLLAGKAFFFMMAFGIPVMLHPVWVVITFYVITALVLGIILSIVFQMAHVVEQAEFPLPNEETDQIESSWAIHQAETTVNFARNSRMLSWFLGGLNFQVEHHLCPKICHVNYPAITAIVEQTCLEYGVKYRSHQTFRAGIASHYRWLRKMGMPDEKK